MKYLSADLRPVFPEERLLLELLLGEKPFAYVEKSVWAANSRYYRLHQYVLNYYESDQKLLPVIINGSNTSLSQAFLLALQRTLAENELLDIMPETNYKAAVAVIQRWKTDFPDTYLQLQKAIDEPIGKFIEDLEDYSTATYEKFERIYPTLTAGSVFSPFLGFDVVELYESAVRGLRSKGYTGIYVVYDEFSGDEKIFPVDGQHRVEGIKKVVSESERYDDEQIPVIFIGHKTDDAGMQRSRRLFSTLNRYAKPVSMRDIIALDEDDVVAIASRDLIDTHPLFARDRLLDSRTKAIPEKNGKAFTTIITFYECNLEILWILLKDMDVLNSEGTKTKGKGKIKEFIRKRPNDETIHQFEELCGAFWNALIERFEDIYTYAAAEPNAQPYRNRAGGNLLFRPVALLPFVRAAVKVSIQQKKDFDEIFGDFPQELLYIDNIIWRNTLWNSDKGTMIVNNQKLTERILLYYWDRSTLTAKEISTMKLEIKSNLQLADMEDVETLLADAIDK